MFPLLLEAVRKGRAWSADSDVQIGIALNSFLRFKIQNTSNNRIAYIYGLGASSSSDLSFTVYKDTTTAVTANPLTPQNQNLKSNETSSLSIAWDTSASDVNGTRLRGYFIPANSPQDYKGEIYMLYPGQTVAMSAKVLATLGGKGLTHISWIEESMT